MNPNTSPSGHSNQELPEGFPPSDTPQGSLIGSEGKQRRKKIPFVSILIKCSPAPSRAKRLKLAESETLNNPGGRIMTYREACREALQNMPIWMKETGWKCYVFTTSPELSGRDAVWRYRYMK